LKLSRGGARDWEVAGDWRWVAHRARRGEANEWTMKGAGRREVGRSRERHGVRKMTGSHTHMQSIRQ
jgi:hypothetical protein